MTKIGNYAKFAIPRKNVFVALCIVVLVVSLIFKMAYQFVLTRARTFAVGNLVLTTVGNLVLKKAIGSGAR
jgi:hypothetical protein